MEAPDHDEVQQLPPLMIIPAQGLNIAGDGSHGVPVVRMVLFNPIAHTTFVLDVEQAREHIKNVEQAIVEAQGLIVPERRLEMP